MALPFLISSILIPFIGVSVDKCGKRAYLLIFAALLGVLTYILFIITNPIFPLILLGIVILIIGFTYAIFACVLWPSLSLVIPKEITVNVYSYIYRE